MFVLQDIQEIKNHAQSLLSSAIKSNEKVLYFNYTKQVLTTVCQTQNNVVYIRESSIKQTIQIATNYTNFQMSDVQIDFAFIEGGDGFLLFRNPFTLYFITPLNQTPIKLTLNTQIKLQTCLVQLNYPNIIVFGTKLESTKSQIFQVSLETLNLKIISDAKGYSPGARTQSLSALVDGRIYTFGGKDSKGKACDQMIWVYDLQKGYWFALEMDYPLEENFSTCQVVTISNSKVLVINKTNGKAWILQIHQSKLTEIKGRFEELGKIKSIQQELVGIYQGQLRICKKVVVHHKK